MPQKGMSHALVVALCILSGCTSDRGDIGAVSLVEVRAVVDSTAGLPARHTTRGHYTKCFLDRRVILDLTDVERAWVLIHDLGGGTVAGYGISLHLNPRGQRKLAEYARKPQHDLVALVLDKRLLAVESLESRRASGGLSFLCYDSLGQAREQVDLINQSKGITREDAP